MIKLDGEKSKHGVLAHENGFGFPVVGVCGGW
jgi:hypothetical protein